MPQADGLMCTGMGPPMAGSFDSGQSLFPLRVWISSGKTLRSVLELPISAGPLDKELPADPSDPNHGEYIELEAVLSGDGTLIDIHEHASDACKAALAASASPALLDRVREKTVVQTACRSVGTYVWRSGKFVRALPTDAHTTSGP